MMDERLSLELEALRDIFSSDHELRIDEAGVSKEERKKRREGLGEGDSQHTHTHEAHTRTHTEHTH